MKILKKTGRWFLQSSAHRQLKKTSPWYMVIWLTGVDYFSSIAYQAGIALLAAGILAPAATAILVLVTLGCCVPIYFEVAKRSFAGQGSIAMLENIIPGWWGKFVVLILLGFAGTDFTITMTLSAADAARHATENHYLKPFLHDAHMTITITLLALLALTFIRGFHEAIILAALVALPYLMLNIIVIFRGIEEILAHPEYLNNWERLLHSHGSWKHILGFSALVFPGLALGLSGFETGVCVMPLIKPVGKKDDPNHHGRIINTKKLLLAAAVIMSFLLLSSSFITALLIPEAAYQDGGDASGRAMAYLAHHLLGNIFGSVYDISTIFILWFAGASAMAGLLNIIPRYLPRFGMAPSWVAHSRPLVLVLFIINIIVTLIFKANVDKQAGAYATGVLALILSAAIAASISLWQEYKASRNIPKFLNAIYYFAVVLVFSYTLIINSTERPDGIIIAAIFILLLILISILSRYKRATELRVEQFVFVNPESEELWKEIKKSHANLLPISRVSDEKMQYKEKYLKEYYNTAGPIVFLRIHLLDNRSDFIENLKIKVRRKGQNYLVEIFQANVIANTVVFASNELLPRAVFIGLTRRNLMNQSIRYFFSGIGETGLMVYEILVRYWENKREKYRPLLFLMSD